jgi:hypothetical protein
VINYFVTEQGRFGIDNYLAQRGAELAGRVNVVTYESLSDVRALPATGTVFAALDQLRASTLSAAAALRQEIRRQCPGARLLNTPGRSLHRYDLLHALHEAGCNRFKAIRANDDPAGLRYPVFIRCEHLHNGSRTPLLEDRAALERALAQLVTRGLLPSELLIVEFVDTRGPDGLYRKYSAMRVGDTILPRHLHAGDQWMLKAQSCIVNEALVREEAEYVSADPHATWLRQVFDFAHIEYGRVDYGLYRGEPQVWEINTNPTFARGTSTAGEARRDQFRHLRDQSREGVHRRLLDAFMSLEAPAPVGTIHVQMDDALRAPLRMEMRAGRRAARLVRLRRTLGASRLAQTVKRALRPALAAAAPMILRRARARR